MLTRRAKIAYDKGYRIEFGEVVSPTGRVLKLKLNFRYPRFNFRSGGKHYTVKCHSLAAWQKFGTDCIGKNTVIRHTDDNQFNFDLSNIELGDPVDNWIDKYLNKQLQADEFEANFKMVSE